MSGFFITSCGTGIGKTFVTSLLVRQCIHAGRKVRAFKPVISGFDVANPADSDTGELLKAQGLDCAEPHISDVSPFRFSAPLSPHMAAVRENKELTLADVLNWQQSLAPYDGLTLIEGVGGVLVPLNFQHTVRDWIVASGLPSIMVVGSYLGSISHSLTAAEALQSKGCSVSAVIVSESPESPVPAEETADTLRHFLLHVPHIIVLPRIADWRAAPLLLECLS